MVSDFGRGDNRYEAFGQAMSYAKNYVEAENNDRKELYVEIAKALKIDASQINKIAGIFAKEWQKPVR